MRTLLSPERLLRKREQYNRRLSMRCEITRPQALPPPAPGYEPEIVPVLLHEDLPCYVWNLLYLLQGEFVFPEREYASGQLRALLPATLTDAEGVTRRLDVKEQDEIRNISVNGEVLWAGPLNIFLVVPHSVTTLLVLRGAH